MCELSPTSGGQLKLQTTGGIINDILFRGDRKPLGSGQTSSAFSEGKKRHFLVGTTRDLNLLIRLLSHNYTTMSSMFRLLFISLFTLVQSVSVTKPRAWCDPPGASVLFRSCLTGTWRWTVSRRRR